MEVKEQRRIQDSILFLGNRNDVNRLYQAMDVFVLPSRYEGLPVVGVEAQAAGLPCVLSDKMTEETKVTENAVFKSLEEKERIWAVVILECQKSRNLGELSQQFDISSQAGKLEVYYCNLNR